jgi:hypothetical protein
MRQDDLKHDGKGRQPCSHPGCPFRSVSILKIHQGHCPYHWAVRIWGRAWADKVFPNYYQQAQKARTHVS